MASSVSDLLTDFRSRFPEFDSTSDSVVELAIGDALNIYNLCDHGVLYLTAHILSLHSDSGVGGSGASVDGGEGETTSESVGGVSASFKSMADRGDDTFYTSTAYGRMFMALKRTSPGRAFSVRVY